MPSIFHIQYLVFKQTSPDTTRDRTERERERKKKRVIEIDPQVIQTMELSDKDFKITMINMSKKIGDKMKNFARHLGSIKK